MAQNPMQTIQTARRGVELVTTLCAFGFGEFVRHTHLAKYLPKTLVPESSLVQGLAWPARVRLLLEELGPTFIKAGQILSTRPDLLGPEWIAELKKLQARVPPAPWDGEQGVEKVLVNAWGPDWATRFKTFSNEPVAAASMGQVYMATLADDRPVVIKVLRPGIHDRLASDMQLMRWLAALVKSELAHHGLDAEALVEEFARQLLREADLTLEAQATARMGKDFENQPGVGFAEVHLDLCHRDVMVQERVQGTLLGDVNFEDLSKEQRRNIVKNGADAVFKQCLSLGFFHADPHPGNIFLQDDGKLVFIDCGMVGTIDPGTTSLLAHIVYGATKGDLNAVLRSAIRLANGQPGLMDDRALRTDVWAFMDRFRGGALSSIDMGAMLNDFMGLLRRHQLMCPADIVYLIKALTTIEGVAEEIDPDFDLLGHVHPYVEQLIKQRYTMEAVKQRLTDAAVAYSDLLEEMPLQVSDLLHAARRNELGLKLQHEGVSDLGDTIRQASMNVAWSLVLAAVVVASSVLILADSMHESISHLTIMATLGFLAAGSVGFVRLVRLWRKHGGNM